MAQRTHITHVSDLSGKEITDNDQPTVSFALDGKAYEIDLTDKEQTKMRDALAEYIGHARSVGRANGGGKKAATKSSSDDAPAIRAWAQSQNLDVPERGRLPKEIKEQWEAAGSPR